MHAQLARLSVFALGAMPILDIIAPLPARAEITGLTVQSTKVIGPFRGKPYLEVEAQLQGTAPGGAYSVPVTLAFPKQASDHNGFAILDVDNTVTIGSKQFPGGAYPLARMQLGEDFLFGRGNAYTSVIWEKFAVEALGNGKIVAPTDTWTILRDAATLARSPAKFLPAQAGTAPTSNKLLAYGFSQTGEVLRAWYFNHLNTKEGKPTFDGALVGGADGACYGAEKREDLPCKGSLADGGKVFALMTETDIEAGGDAERGDNPDYRTIETAGVAHIPGSLFDLRDKGDRQQNPVSFGPVFRAALVNLQEWVRNGREPPPSIAIKLTDAPAKDVEGLGSVRQAQRDEGGNAVGGVRLPHMTSVLRDDRKAGAPLGQYGGIAYDFAKDNIFFAIAGTFKPFPPEKLKALYPTHAAYVDLVKASAEDLVAERYILPEDAKTYIEAAEASDIGRR